MNLFSFLRKGTEPDAPSARETASAPPTLVKIKRRDGKEYSLPDRLGSTVFEAAGMLQLRMRNRFLDGDAPDIDELDKLIKENMDAVVALIQAIYGDDSWRMSFGFDMRATAQLRVQQMMRDQRARRKEQGE